MDVISLSDVKRSENYAMENYNANNLFKLKLCDILFKTCCVFSSVET